VTLEHEMTVRSRRTSWLSRQQLKRVHLDTAGFLGGVDERGNRMVFTVDDHLFSLTLELHRPDAPVESTLAGGK
jgi:hypothetical protein